MIHFSELFVSNLQNLFSFSSTSIFWHTQLSTPSSGQLLAYFLPFIIIFGQAT